MREPRPSHNPPARRCLLEVEAETDLPSLFETYWSQRFTGKILFHFRSGYPSVIDELTAGRRRRWLIRRPPP